MSRESVCHSELTDDTHLAVYAVSTQPATGSPTQVTIGAQSPSNDSTAEEPYAGFNTQIQQILSEADTLHNEADRQGFKKALQKYKDSFAKDSLDCGLTNIHTVHIPTIPNAPPTFVRQYKIPIASYEPVQENVDSMLEKGIIRPVTFLNGQRIRDGVVTKARIATWLMTLQGRDVEARYAQNYKSSLGNGLAACQNCSTDMLHTPAEPKEPPQPQLTNHRYFKENVCVKACPQHMSMAAPTTTRAIYKREWEWSGSTTTLVHRDNST